MLLADPAQVSWPDTKEEEDFSVLQNLEILNQIFAEYEEIKEIMDAVEQMFTVGMTSTSGEVLLAFLVYRVKYRPGVRY